MNKQDAIRHFGSMAELARWLGISICAVSQWGEKVPELRAYQIERLTGGALKAEQPQADEAKTA